MRNRFSFVVAGAALGIAGHAVAQQPAPQQPDPTPLVVGTVAPDFALSGSTRFGLLKGPVHLSDFKGKTVILAFYYRARTRG